MILPGRREVVWVPELESQMLGLHPLSPSKARLIVATGLLLSLGATVSYADNAHELAAARGAHATAAPSSRAVYGDRAFVPNDARPSNECVGGYRWIQRIDDANLTPAESQVPVRCN